MKRILSLILVFQMTFAQPARADMFGGDILYLAQILANAVKQLAELQSILANSQDSLNLMKDINKGINDSLSLMKTISPNSDPGIYKEWDKVSDALKNVENIYGSVIESNDFQVQKDTDQSVAEAVTFNNKIFEYTKKIDEIGELIKQESHNVSPGGAAKLTAQSLGVMLHIQNESLRAQATGLKLQAQSMALENRKDKERTRQMTVGTDNLASALSNQKTSFSLPRFD